MSTKESVTCVESATFVEAVVMGFVAKGTCLGGTPAVRSAHATRRLASAASAREDDERSAFKRAFRTVLRGRTGPRRPEHTSLPPSMRSVNRLRVSSCVPVQLSGLQPSPRRIS